MMQKRRDTGLDIVRCSAILCVLGIHAIGFSPFSVFVIGTTMGGGFSKFY